MLKYDIDIVTNNIIKLFTRFNNITRNFKTKVDRNVLKINIKHNNGVFYDRYMYYLFYPCILGLSSCLYHLLYSYTVLTTIVLFVTTKTSAVRTHFLFCVVPSAIFFIIVIG